MYSTWQQALLLLLVNLMLILPLTEQDLSSDKSCSKHVVVQVPSCTGSTLWNRSNLQMINGTSKHSPFHRRMPSRVERAKMFPAPGTSLDISLVLGPCYDSWTPEAKFSESQIINYHILSASGTVHLFQTVSETLKQCVTNMTIQQF